MNCPKNCTSCNLHAGSVYCSACSTGYNIDSSNRLCRPNCPPQMAYNWTASACMTCRTGTIFNSTTKSCQACPKYCGSCYLNSTSGNISCSSCTSSNILDQTYKLCKTPCYYGSVFYWDTMSCRSCPASQSYSYATNACAKCPWGCVTCKNQDGYSTPSCISCNSSTVYDFSTMRCKLPC